MLDLSDGVVLATYDTHTVYDFARLGETSTDAYIDHTPGAWSDPPSGVPEPSNAAMMICGALPVHRMEGLLQNGQAARSRAGSGGIGFRWRASLVRGLKSPGSPTRNISIQSEKLL
jgi:hypothetical protein